VAFTFKHFPHEVEACTHRKTKHPSALLKSQQTSSKGKHSSGLLCFRLDTVAGRVANASEHSSYCHPREPRTMGTAEEGNTQGRTQHSLFP